MKDSVVVTNHARFLVRPEVDAEPVALWRQLKQSLRDLALTGLQPGDRLPTEEELCRQHGVSRTTARQAVASLVAEGVLYRRQGSGTYVAPRKIEEQVGLEEFAYLPNHPGASPPEVTFLLLSAEEIPPDERLKQRLSVTGSDLVYKIRRLRLFGGDPMASQVTYVPRRLCPGLLSADLASGSLRTLIEDRYGIRLARIDATVEVMTADEYRAELLRVPVGFPLVLIERTTLSASGTPVLYSRLFFRHDRCKLLVSVGVSERTTGCQWSKLM